MDKLLHCYNSFNIALTDNTQVCDWRFKHTKHITIYVVPRKHFFKILKKCFFFTDREFDSWTNDCIEFIIKPIASKGWHWLRDSGKLFVQSFFALENFRSLRPISRRVTTHYDMIEDVNMPHIAAALWVISKKGAI